MYSEDAWSAGDHSSSCDIQESQIRCFLSQCEQIGVFGDFICRSQDSHQEQVHVPHRSQLDAPRLVMISLSRWTVLIAKASFIPGVTKRCSYVTSKIWISGFFVWNWLEIVFKRVQSGFFRGAALPSPEAAIVTISHSGNSIVCGEKPEPSVIPKNTWFIQVTYWFHSQQLLAELLSNTRKKKPGVACPVRSTACDGFSGSVTL